MTDRRRLFRRILFLLGGTAVLYLLGTLLLVADGLRDRPGKADVALVLGSKVMPNGKPSPRLRARLDETVARYRAGWFPVVIASGGLGKEGFDEAVVMRNYLAAHGIPSDRIIVDSNGVTTYASAKNTLHIARERHFQSVFVISQYFHISRARLALKRFGISPVYSAHAYDFFEARDLYSLMRELPGYVKYLFRRYETPKA